MDFSSLSGKASMKRKQSNSVLGNFAKPSRVSAIPLGSGVTYPTPSTSTSSHFSDDILSPESPYASTEPSSSRTTSSQYHLPLGSGRRTSDAGISLTREPTQSRKTEGNAVIRRPEDMFKVVKDRLFCWSYMMQWYQGDVHWLNTVKISRSAVESSLGLAKVDQRARSFFVLGASLSALFDIAVATDFLKALLKLLDEWEAFAENSGGKGVKNLFRGQKQAKKPSAGGMAEMSSGISDSESLLLNVPLPFSPDFLQVHSTTCSIIRDLYKKILGMVLPSRTGVVNPHLPIYSNSAEHNSIFHPSTIIHSAPKDSSLSRLSDTSAPMSPSTQSVSSHSFSFIGSGGDSSISSPSILPGKDANGEPVSLNSSAPTAVQQDAFQALAAGQLAPDRVLVGDGQKLTPQVIELFTKVDARLRKHFSILLREGDTLARRVLDDELAALTMSLTHGPPMKFDVMAGMSATGNGYYGASPNIDLSTAYSGSPVMGD